MSQRLSHGLRSDVREKRSKEKIATDNLRMQRRDELEEGRAAIAQLEKRIAEAQAAGEQGRSKAAPKNEQMRKLVLDLAEEKKKVSWCWRRS